MGLVTVNPRFVNRVFDEFFQNANVAERTPVKRSFVPAVNVQETEDNFQLELAVPGFEKDDIKVEVNEGVLLIAGEHKTVEANETDNYTRREFHYANFNRRFTLPETADDAQISATYTNGILTVVLPKKEEAKPQPARLIEVG
jgi:HSP20 family protein